MFGAIESTNAPIEHVSPRQGKMPLIQPQQAPRSLLSSIDLKEKNNAAMARVFEKARVQSNTQLS